MKIKACDAVKKKQEYREAATTISLIIEYFQAYENQKKSSDFAEACKIKSAYDLKDALNKAYNACTECETRYTKALEQEIEA